MLTNPIIGGSWHNGSLRKFDNEVQIFGTKSQGYLTLQNVKMSVKANALLANYCQ